MPAPVRIAVEARPSASGEGISWDAWRHRWRIHVRAPPLGGKANRALLEVLVRWLGVPPDSVRWVRAGSSRSKLVEVDGLEPEEIVRRLQAAPRPGRSGGLSVEGGGPRPDVGDRG